MEEKTEIKEEFEEKTGVRPDYRNWVPKGMIYGLAACAAAALAAFVLFAAAVVPVKGTLRLALAFVSGCAALVLVLYALRMRNMYLAFDYNGKRRLSGGIVEGIAAYVKIPDGGTGLDVGCGSGALTIACAKANPKAEMVGIDIWKGAYAGIFSRKLCEDNARAEGVSNIRFEQASALKLPFEDESFDAVTSNYVYHNITGTDRQKLLLETLRVLKKGGVFAIHDLMDKHGYGDMDAFVRRMRESGSCESIKRIDTTGGMFMSKREAGRLSLRGSSLLVGRK